MDIRHLLDSISTLAWHMLPVLNPAEARLLLFYFWGPRHYQVNGSRMSENRKYTYTPLAS